MPSPIVALSRAPCVAVSRARWTRRASSSRIAAGGDGAWDADADARFRDDRGRRGGRERRDGSRWSSRDAERDANERRRMREAAERDAERRGGFRVVERADGTRPRRGGDDDDGDDRRAFGSAFAREDAYGGGERWGDDRASSRETSSGRRGRGGGRFEGRGGGRGGRFGGRGGRGGARGARGGRVDGRGRGGRGEARRGRGGEGVRGFRDGGGDRYERRGDTRRGDEYDDDEDDFDDDDDDDDWILQGLEDELEDGRQWGAGQNDPYLPELLSKYVEDDFEPMVYTREPEDLDEYSFFSGARFGQLGASEEARASLKERFNIERPSHIQAMSYRVLSGDDAQSPERARHVLLADQAGSGKTLAYLLPLLQRVQKIEEQKGRSKPRKPRLLVLTPTSELATQVREVVKQLSFGGLRSRSLLANNVSKSRTQIEALVDGVDIVVGTPGRVARLIEEGKMLTDDVDAVVLDECDVLLGENFEFAEQVAPIRNATKPGTQFVLVTATIPDDVLRQLKDFFESDIRVVQGPGLHRPAAGMIERLIDCSGGDVFDDQSGFYRKFKALIDLLDVDKADRTLLFCNKIDTCRKIENFLTRADRDGDKYKILPYHAALSREQQQANLREFIRSPSKTPHILVCTDRASRGLDASRVKHVILFDFPRDPSEYVRRVGRTARGALGQGRVSVFVLGRQVRLAREIMRRNDRGDPVEATPTNF